MSAIFEQSSGRYETSIGAPSMETNAFSKQFIDPNSHGMQFSGLFQVHLLRHTRFESLKKLGHHAGFHAQVMLRQLTNRTLTSKDLRQTTPLLYLEDMLLRS